MASLTTKKQVEEQNFGHDWMFLHCISAALKKKTQLLSNVKNKNDAKTQQRMFKKWRVLLKLCYVPFFLLSQLSYVHEFPSSCLCHRLHRVKWAEQGGKCPRKIARKGGKKRGKKRQVERGSDYQPLWEQKEERLCIQLFSIYLEREVADEKCF